MIQEALLQHQEAEEQDHNHSLNLLRTSTVVMIYLIITDMLQTLRIKILQNTIETIETTTL
jgi:hypothetical protein